jgi:hypothetical protein
MPTEEEKMVDEPHSEPLLQFAFEYKDFKFYIKKE